MAPVIPSLLITFSFFLKEFTEARRILLISLIYGLVTTAGMKVIYQKAIDETKSIDVGMAKWIVENTDEDDLIAANDIGAIGYFSERRILDLGGLIDPNVTKHLKNGTLWNYIKERKPDYMIIFPEWDKYMKIMNYESKEIMEKKYEVNVSNRLIVGGNYMVAYKMNWK